MLKLTNFPSPLSTVTLNPKTLIEIAMDFDEHELFAVKFARFRNFFDFAQILGILESDKL